MLHGYLPAAVLLARKLDTQELDFAVDCAMWNDFFSFFQKGRWCKAAFPYTVPSTDASPRMVLSTDGYEHRLIPAKNRYWPVRQLVSQSDS